MSMDRARELVAEIAGPGAAGEIGPDDDLVMAGVDSGDLIRLALSIEERYDAQLDADRLAELRTLRALEGLLEQLERAGAAERPAGAGS